MKESAITSRLITKCKEVMPGAVIFKHFDVSTDGIPDLSITWRRRTLWVEVKFMDGETRPTQIITMQQLARMGQAWYVRFTVIDVGRVTDIYSPVFHPGAPNGIHNPGWDTEWVAKFFRETLEAAV